MHKGINNQSVCKWYNVATVSLVTRNATMFVLVAMRVSDRQTITWRRRWPKSHYRCSVLTPLHIVYKRITKIYFKFSFNSHSLILANINLSLFFRDVTVNRLRPSLPLTSHLLCLCRCNAMVPSLPPHHFVLPDYWWHTASGSLTMFNTTSGL